MRAEKILQKKLFDHPKIEVIWDSEIKEILGSDNPPSVENITVRNMISNAESQIDVDGVFIAIGHSPSSKIFKDKLKISDTGYILTDPGTQTSIPGVFAAGDVSDQNIQTSCNSCWNGMYGRPRSRKFFIFE